MTTLDRPTRLEPRGARPAPPRRRYDLLDAFRGLACLGVMAHHSAFYVRTSGADPVAERLIAGFHLGWLGVPVFFVISGYCIAASADSRRWRQDAAAGFFRRRFRRIYPPFWIYLALVSAGLMLASAAGLGGLFEDRVHPISLPASLSLPQWLGNLTLTETWRPYLGGGPSRFLVGHAWTLCYEEQFYAVSGLLLVLAPKRWFTGVALVSAGVLLARVARRYYPQLPYDGLFYDGQWLLFAAGIVVYGVLTYRRAPTWAATAAALLAPAGGFAALAARRPGWATDGVSFAVGLAFAAGLLALAPREARLAAHPLLRPLNWCGVRCYSLYLIHWPIAKGLSHAAAEAGRDGPWFTLLATFPAIAALSVAATALFHVAVERRFLTAPPSPARPAPPA